MRNRRGVVAGLALILILLSAIGISLPPKLSKFLEEFGVPVPKLLSERAPSDFAALGALPNTAKSFSAAKRWLYEDVYDDRRETFYCRCDFNRVKTVDLPSCGVSPRKNKKRALRVEAEHVFPASQFGYYRRCWRNPAAVCGEKVSGRECCRRADPLFEAAHNDLHNLFPAIGEVNGIAQTTDGV